MKNILLGVFALTLVACTPRPEDPPKPDAAKPAVTVTARAVTATTFRHSANDSAVWIQPDPRESLLFVTGGEGGLELHDLQGKQLARFESVEAGFVDVRRQVATQLPDMVIASIPGEGALRVYSFDAAARQIKDVTAAAIAVNDEITGLCTYASALTDKLYAFVVTDQGQIAQFELFVEAGKIAGRFIRSIAAGHGAGHCVVDDASASLYFSEESVGIWRVAAEPESDASRVAVDLVAPRGGIEEEVKGLAIHRNGGAAQLVAGNAGNSTFNVYSLEGEPAGSFAVGGSGADIGDAEGLAAVSGSLGDAFPQGALIIADEDAGNYKLVAWNDIASALALPAGDAAAGAKAPAKAPIVEPVAETEPVASYGDAADDPAIWVNRRDPGRSVVIATNKKLGLDVYDLSGRRLQTLADGRMNNVDLRDGFMLAGKSVIVVAATNRTTRSISLYTLDPVARRLAPVSDGVLDAGLADPYGLCMYHSAKSGDFFVLANDSVDGKLRQWKLVARGERIGIEAVRDIAVGSQAEGCVADDELGHLYVAEEDVGIWKYGAEPGTGDARTAVDQVKTGHLSADVEGLAIHAGADGEGFLIASNQGEDNYALYRREGTNEFVGKFHVVANEARGIDGASETDGLDVVSAPLGTNFPDGMLVVQDGRNLMPAAPQNFKFVSWRDVVQSITPVVTGP